MLRLALVVSVVTAGGIVVGAVPASAATTVYATGVGGYTTQPSTAGKTNLIPPGPAIVFFDLGARIVVPAGTTSYLSSKLVVGSAAEDTEVSPVVYCRLPGATDVYSQLVSGQNVLKAVTTTILTRGFITAPASPLTCSLQAKFINHAAPSPGHIYVLSSTYLQDVYGPIPSFAQTWQTSRVLVNTSYLAAPVSYTAPAGVTSVQAIGDVNVTTCYGTPAGACLGGRTAGTSAYVGTQLLVRQLNSDGSVCATTKNGSLVGVVVTDEVHHFKINTWITNVPVSASCSSRNFSAYTYVTANAASQSIIVEPYNETVTAMFVP